MPKHILHCADGTWNGPGDPKNNADIDGMVNLEAALEKTTNVVKLFRNLARAVTSETQPFPNEWEKALPGESGAPLQVAKYMHGVGDSSNLLMKALGGARCVYGPGARRNDRGGGVAQSGQVRRDR